MQSAGQSRGPWLPLHEVVESLLSELGKERRMLQPNSDQEREQPALVAAS